MRILFLLVLVAILLAVGDAKRCRSSEDCSDDECCIARSIFGYRKGDCRKIAKKGEECSENDEFIGLARRQYFEHCPCDSGLSCQPTKLEYIKGLGTFKFDERCIEDASQTTPVTETPKPDPETPEPEKETPEPEKETPEPEKETLEPEKETLEPEKETPEPETETPNPETESPSV